MTEHGVFVWLHGFDEGQDNVTGFESLCSEFFLNEIVFIFEILEVWCICGEDQEIDFAFEDTFKDFHNRIDEDVHLMILFADFNKETENTVLNDNGVDDIIFLSVNDHNIKNFDEVEMFGLDFGFLWKKLLKGKNEGQDGSVDLKEVDFGLELNGGTGWLVKLIVLDYDHEQELSKVPFDNSWDDRQMVGIAICPYNIDWGQVNNIFHIIGVRNEFKKLDTVINIARIFYDVILEFEQIFHLNFKLIL